MVVEVEAGRVETPDCVVIVVETERAEALGCSVCCVVKTRRVETPGCLVYGLNSA